MEKFKTCPSFKIVAKGLRSLQLTRSQINLIHMHMHHDCIFWNMPQDKIIFSIYLPAHFPLD